MDNKQSFSSNNYNTPPKKSNAGLISGVVVGIVLLMGIVVAIILALTIFSGPSKADYEKAHEHISIMEITQKKLDIQKSNKGDVNSSKKAIARLKKDSEELGKMKAVTGDKEIKEVYDRFMAKLKKFIDNRAAIIESVEIMLATKSDGRPIYSRLSGYEKEIRKLRAIEVNIKNKVNKKFVEDDIKNYNALIEMVKQHGEGDYPPLIQGDYNDLIRKGYRLFQKWRKEMYIIAENDDITKDFNDLSEIIAKKADAKN